MVDMTEVLNKIGELATVYGWLYKNSVIINIEKTKCMFWGKSRFRSEVEMEHKIILVDSVLEWVKIFKYLGVIIDNFLNIKDDDEYINIKMAIKVKLICKLKQENNFYSNYWQYLI